MFDFIKEELKATREDRQSFKRSVELEKQRIAQTRKDTKKNIVRKIKIIDTLSAKRDAKKDEKALNEFCVAEKSRIRSIQSARRRSLVKQNKKSIIGIGAGIAAVLVAVSVLAGSGNDYSNADIAQLSNPVIVESRDNDISQAQEWHDSTTKDSKPDTKPEITQPVAEVPSAFDLSSVGTFSESPYVEVNGNVPYFNMDELTDTSFESYSLLDSLGRCGTAVASIGSDDLNESAQNANEQIEPSGWQTVRYDWIDGEHLYNRCQLIGSLLTRTDADEKNLFTGTSYLKTEGMLPFVNRVAEYVKETNNHVLYRISPIFEGDNLVASGVLMEAMSCEDSGKGLQFCVFCFNVQPGISIDYATGESQPDDAAADDAQQSNVGDGYNDTPDVSAEQTPASVPNPTPESDDNSGSTDPSDFYVLNTNSRKFHRPNCKSVKRMSEENKAEFNGSRSDVIAMGYDPCKNCDP